MVHCDPAPPHPPPDVVYRALCPPFGLNLFESMALFGLLFAGIAVIIWLLGNRHTVSYPRD